MGASLLGCAALWVVLAAEPSSSFETPLQSLDLEPGDRFIVDVDFAHAWSVETYARRPSGRSSNPVGTRVVTGGSPSGGPSPTVGAAPSAARPTFRRPSPPAPARPTPPAASRRSGQSSTESRDPLFVHLRLHGEVSEGRRLALRTEVLEVHYTDHRGTQWTLRPGAPETESAVETMTRKLAERCLTASRIGQEREMVEEQLLGLGIVCADGLSLRADLDSLAQNVSLGELDSVLETRLPSDYPPDLRPFVRPFFEEALSKIVAPRAEDGRVNLPIVSNGIPYHVEAYGRRGKRPVVRIFGKTYNAASGIGVKDQITMDTTTGLVLQRSYLRYQDAIHSQRVIFDSRKWQISLRAFEPSD